jgi:hypothetical protein
MKTRTTVRQILVATLLASSVAAGCSQNKQPNTVMESPFPEPMTLAVAPVLNFSGEFALDPLTAADLLASELASVDGIAILPVNRVTAYLATQGKRQIESPAHAVAIAQAVNADAIVVAGITEYDPYTPIVGLVVQMYSVPRRSRTAPPGLDPVAVERSASPITLADLPDTTEAANPTSQVQVVFNANHEWVVKAVRKYAEHRSEEFSPYGWKQYLKVQTLYLRFCWHEAIERLVRQERERRALATGDQPME